MDNKWLLIKGKIKDAIESHIPKRRTPPNMFNKPGVINEKIMLKFRKKQSVAKIHGDQGWREIQGLL